MPERRTREGVEIARVGTHPLSTGRFTFTREHLASALQNAQTQAPVIGIGHTDPRFNLPDADGDPALGRVVNLRLAEDGDLLVGDFDGLPAWLDDGLDIAYPRRSLEGRADGADLRLSSVKLLGTTLPAIKGLRDLPAAIAASADGTFEERAEAVTHVLMAASKLDELREAFYRAHPVVIADWHVAEVQVDPDLLIMACADQTFRVPWTANADGTFTFGGMQEVTVQYVDAAASAGGGHVVYREPARRPIPTPEEESIVDPKTLRTQLGLAEDASDEDVAGKITELAARPDEAQVTSTVSEAVAAKEAEIAASAEKPKDDPGVVRLEQGVFDDLKASAELGKAAHDRQVREDRERFIAAAVSEGKIAPARKDHWTTLIENDDEGTRAVIDGLEKGALPVEEIGASASDEEIEASASLDSWFPQLAGQEA